MVGWELLHELLERTLSGLSWLIIAGILAALILIWLIWRLTRSDNPPSDDDWGDF